MYRRLRVETRSFLIMSPRAFEIALRIKRVTKLVMRLRVIGIKPERSLKLLNRFVDLAVFRKKHAIIVVYYACSRSRLRSKLKLRSCFIFAAKERKNATVLGPDFAFAWQSAQCFLQLIAGIIQPRLRQADLAQGKMNLFLVRIQPKGDLTLLRRLLESICFLQAKGVPPMSEATIR